MNIKAYVSELHQFLDSLGDEEYAQAQSKYMMGRFPFFGIRNPDRKRYWNEFQEVHGKLTPDDMFLFVEECMNYAEREIWYIALDSLAKYKKHLKAHHLDFVRDFIVKSAWWDIVDIAINHLVGQICKSYPEIKLTVNDWNEHSNIWLRRASIIYQNTFRLDTDEIALYQNILNRAHEKEFFIRKAIGWALREYSKHRPESVRGFLVIHEAKLSPLSLREARKYV